MKKRAQVGIYFVFLIIATIVVIITALIAPLGSDMTQRFYIAGEGIINNSQSSLALIQDSNVKDQLDDIYAGAKANTVTNIEVTSGLYKYAWLIVIILSAVVLFLFTRRLVEYGQVV